MKTLDADDELTFPLYPIKRDYPIDPELQELFDYIHNLTPTHKKCLKFCPYSDLMKVTLHTTRVKRVLERTNDDQTDLIEKYKVVVDYLKTHILRAKHPLAYAQQLDKIGVAEDCERVEDLRITKLSDGQIEDYWESQLYYSEGLN